MASNERTNSTSTFLKYLHHGWRKFWSLMRWNGLERKNSTSIFSKCQCVFTMVEENSWLNAYLHYGWRKFLNFGALKWLWKNFSNFYFLIVSSPWLKKILNFDALKWLRTNKFNFYFLKVFSPWLEKILNFNAFKRLRTNKFNSYFLKVSSPWLEKIEF